MKAYLERFGHETQLGTDFQSASVALADFMYQVRRCMLLCWIIGFRSGRHSSLLPQHLHPFCLLAISFCLVHVWPPHAAQVALPHYREAWFLARAAARYKRFLHLHRLQDDAHPAARHQPLLAHAPGKRAPFSAPAARVACSKPLFLLALLADVPVGFTCCRDATPANRTGAHPQRSSRSGIVDIEVQKTLLFARAGVARGVLRR